MYAIEVTAHSKTNMNFLSNCFMLCLSRTKFLINKCLYQIFGIGSRQHITVIRTDFEIDLVEIIVSNQYAKFLESLCGRPVFESTIEILNIRV